LTLLIGSYAQSYYLGDKRLKTLTATVKNYSAYLPKYLSLPHPSPRNNIWMAKNKWFEKEIIPFLQNSIHQIISNF
ncbi:MAG: uracil-DNA glycosylase family protein, partial [Bacteroidota bacterium]